MAYDSELSNQTIQELNNLLRDIEKRTYDHIVKMMNDAGLALLSFVHNGDDNSFDVDKTYTGIEIDHNNINVEVVAVLCHEDILYLIADRTFAAIVTADFMEGKIALPLDEIPADILDKLTSKGYCVDEVFTPADTLNDLLFSVSEIIDIVLGKK